MKKKKFDCVEMKRRGAEIVQRKIARMSPEEEVEFWQKHTEALRKKQEELQTQTQATQE